MATIKEIAALAKVSQATVSRVLNQDETLTVTPQVRDSIFKIAHELNYVPPKMRHRKHEEKIVIGVADWHIVRKDRPDMKLESLGCVAASMSESVNVEFVRLCYGELKQVDGIIAFGSFSEQEMTDLRRQSYTILFVNSVQTDYEFDRIVMDYRQGVEQMVSYLLEQKEYRSVGYIGGFYEDDVVKIGHRRLDSLKEILQEHDCYDEKYFFVGEMSREGGHIQAEQMFAAGNIPEVLILGNDEVAEGVMEVVKEKKCRVPKDVAIVIYRDIETLETKYPTYTSLCMLPDIVWSTAIRLLTERIYGRRSESLRVYLPARLEVGDSA